MTVTSIEYESPDVTTIQKMEEVRRMIIRVIKSLSDGHGGKSLPVTCECEERSRIPSIPGGKAR